MFPHHAQTIDRLVHALQSDSAILALILGGSIAHGFARPDSDIDVTFVISTSDYQRRQREGRLHYNNRELCTYDGYIDGKYVDLDFLKLVAARGSDPIRYAYEGNRILFSRLDDLDSLLAAIVRFPVEEKAARLERFAAQLLAWRWYYSESLRQQNRYLSFLALQKLVLFSARLILTENEILFPYHKWMLRVVASAPRQPENFLRDLDTLLTFPAWETVDAHVRRLLAFLGIDFATADAAWPTRFMKDTELRWVAEEACIDDI
jgi:Predicted nucleotidyltransferase